MKLKGPFWFVATFWLLGLLFNLALIGAAIYVAAHFIAKWW